MRLGRPATLLALCLLVIASLGGGAAAQDPGGSGADSTATAVADSARTPISSDGAITVYEELRPGEGIEGFYWAYDPLSDLQRLVDTRRRDEELEPLRDSFGFELVVPDSIAALRDSVTAVADSIIAARVEIETVFDPKLATSYNEVKDNYEYGNKLDLAVPMTRRGNVVIALNDRNNYNSSTKRAQDQLTLSSTFSFKLHPELKTSLGLSVGENTLELDGVQDSKATDQDVNGRVFWDRPAPLGFTMNSSLGVMVGEKKYQTRLTDGTAKQLTPTWTTKFTRPFTNGSLALDYQGGAGRAKRREVRTIVAVDSVAADSVDVTETDDRNANHRGTVSMTWNPVQDWTARVNGGASADRFQYISQQDSVVGRQETRRQGSRDGSLNLTGKPTQTIEIKSNLSWRQSDTQYELEPGRYSKTTTRAGTTDLSWTPYAGSRTKVTIERNVEDRDYLTSQAGQVDKKRLVVDWNQDITERVELVSVYTLRLDSYYYDRADGNTGDRDLRSERATFTVRYNPSGILSTNVKMDIRKDGTVNLSPSRSGGNKTDYVYIVTPGYSLRLGAANISGDFTANARYNVFDFDEDRNSLTRRFYTQQKWQHKFSERVSTELLGTYEYSDEGSYRRSSADGIRRFGRTREILRYRFDSTVLYNPRQWIRVSASYRADGEDQYTLTETSRTKSGNTRTGEFSYGMNVKRRIMKTIQVNLDFRQFLRDGARIADVDRNYYKIQATVE
ncbi:MAG: hypothetical protein KC591_12715, partial [Gemmatimonadetes bacterium]|nr:hypothetical protein [Gemmatimonadota bacterium]